MRGVVKGSIVGCDNPTLFFTHQVEGLLKDLEALKLEIFDVTGGGPALSVVAEADLDLSDCPTGVRLGIGRYAASFNSAAFKTGTHELRWRYQVATGDPFRNARQRFEVLDPNEFVHDDEFVGYASTKDLISQGFTQPIGKLQRLIKRASRRVEALTSRFFEPRFLELRLNSRGTRALSPGDPIIGIDEILIETTGVGGVLTQTPIDPGLFKIFNRHLTGLINPDDRDNPRIELFDVIPRRDRPAVPLGFKFFPGPLVARIPGVYGYTDPNGTPFGEEPDELVGVVTSFVAEAAISASGGGAAAGGGGIIKSAKTRDQSVTFATAREGGLGPLTGNRQVDDVLLRFMRPPHYGAV